MCVQVVPQASLCDLCNIVVTFAKPYVDNNSTRVSLLLETSLTVSLKSSEVAGIKFKSF